MKSFSLSFCLFRFLFFPRLIVISPFIACSSLWLENIIILLLPFLRWFLFIICLLWWWIPYIRIFSGRWRRHIIDRTLRINRVNGIIVIVVFLNIISSPQLSKENFIWVLWLYFWWRYLKLILSCRRGCIFPLMMLKGNLIEWQSRLSVVFLEFWTLLDYFRLLGWRLL